MYCWFLSFFVLQSEAGAAHGNRASIFHRTLRYPTSQCCQQTWEFRDAVFEDVITPHHIPELPTKCRQAGSSSSSGTHPPYR